MYYTELPPPDDEVLEKQLDGGDDDRSDRSDAEEEEERPKVHFIKTLTDVFRRKRRREGSSSPKDSIWMTISLIYDELHERTEIKCYYRIVNNFHK